MQSPNSKQAVSQIHACRAYFNSGITVQDKQKALQGFEAGLATLNKKAKQEPNQSILLIIQKLQVS